MCPGDVNDDRVVNCADPAVCLATFGNTWDECTFSTHWACLNFQYVIAGCDPGLADGVGGGTSTARGGLPPGAKAVPGFVQAACI